MKKNLERIFKALKGNGASKKRKLKENRRKSKDRKSKRFENSVRHVCHICVANPLTNDLPHCLLFLPSLTIPEACINLEDISTLLLRQDTSFIAYRLLANDFSNAAGSRTLTNLEPDIRDRACYILKIMTRKTRVKRKKKKAMKKRKRTTKKKTKRKETVEKFNDFYKNDNISPIKNLVLLKRCYLY